MKSGLANKSIRLMTADTTSITTSIYCRLAPNKFFKKVFRKSRRVVKDSPCGIGIKNIKIPNAEHKINFSMFFVFTFELFIFPPIITFLLLPLPERSFLLLPDTVYVPYLGLQQSHAALLLNYHGSLPPAFGQAWKESRVL